MSTTPKDTAQLYFTAYWSLQTQIPGESLGISTSSAPCIYNRNLEEQIASLLTAAEVRYVTTQDDNGIESPISAVEKKQARPHIDESALSDKERQELRSFAEMQEMADAIDKVLTKNGPPELDLTSG